MPIDKRCGIIGNFQDPDPFHCKILKPDDPQFDALEENAANTNSEVPEKELGTEGIKANAFSSTFPDFVPVTETNNPCYLPQPNDLMLAKDNQEPMGPIGPWATGKVDWSPLAGLTGTRPVVDRYSITRFSGAEWREHNRKLLTECSDQCLASLRYVIH